MSKSLVNIVNESLKLEQMLIESGGEVSPDVEAFLAVNAEELAEKVDGYHTIIERFKALKDHYSEKADFFKMVSSQCDNAAKRLKENIEFAMGQLGVDEVKGEDIRFKLVTGAGRLIIKDEELIPVEFKKEEITTVVQKDALKEALKRGEQIAGAELEYKPSARAYPNIPDKKAKTKELKNV